ncbi:MAG: hypothetical protein ACKO83_07905, partial [Roseiflexaceae bacterium]
MRAVTVLMLLYSILFTHIPTSYAAPISAPLIDVANGGFEDSITPTGWTVVQNRTDLGVTSIAGCATVDNTPYSVLQSYTPIAAPINDNGPLTTNSPSASLTNLVKASGVRSMKMTMSATAAAGSYFVAYGPHIYSSTFSATAGQVVRMEFLGLSNNYLTASPDLVAIQAWIQRSDCASASRVSLASGASHETSGGNGHFAMGSATVATSGTYRVVVVMGVFDKNGDGSVGGNLYVDNATFGTSQTVDWGATSFANPYIGQSYDLTGLATASSGLALTYRALPTTTCTVSGSTLRLVGPGICYLMAVQSGNGTYAAASLIYKYGKGFAVARITITPTHTRTPTLTNTRTITSTRPPSLTPTNTNTPTPTRTATNSMTPTNTTTATLTRSHTFTPTQSFTRTLSPTNTPTSSRTSTSTPTRTFTRTFTRTSTLTFTRTNTPTRTVAPVAFKDAAIGNLYVLGLMHNGTLATWGKNTLLQAQFHINVQPES